jgi:hypothetical protein
MYDTIWNFCAKCTVLQRHTRDGLFATNYYTKTLFFCANFFRKITKIKIYEQLTILCFDIFVHADGTHVWNILHINIFLTILVYDNMFEIIDFAKILLFCTNFLWKTTKIELSGQLYYTLLFYAQHFRYV